MISDELKFYYHGEIFKEEIQAFYDYFVENAEVPENVDVEIWGLAALSQFTTVPAVHIQCQLNCDIRHFMNRMEFTYRIREEYGDTSWFEGIVNSFEIRLGKKLDIMQDKIDKLKNSMTNMPI